MDDPKEFLMKELQRGKISPNAIRHYCGMIDGFKHYADQEEIDIVKLYDELRSGKSHKTNSSAGVENGKVKKTKKTKAEKVGQQPEPVTDDADLL